MVELRYTARLIANNNFPKFQYSSKERAFGAIFHFPFSSKGVPSAQFIIYNFKFVYKKLSATGSNQNN